MHQTRKNFPLVELFHELGHRSFQVFKCFRFLKFCRVSFCIYVFIAFVCRKNHVKIINLNELLKPIILLIYACFAANFAANTDVYLVAILNSRLEKIQKFNIVTAVTCVIVVKNFNFSTFENENVKTLS